MANLVASFTPGANRNDFGGFLGMRFTPTVSATVSSLGRRKATGNTGNQTVYLLNASLATVASAVIDMTAASVGDFVYASITPTVMTAGSAYYLVCLATNGGQLWSDVGPTTLNNAGTINAMIGGATTSSSYTVWTANQQYMGLDLIVWDSALPGPGAVTFTGFAPTSTGGITSTQAIFTQIGTEAWVSNTPAVVATQIGAEAWVSNTPAMIATQIGVEAWRSVADGAAPVLGHIIFTGKAPNISSDTQVGVGAIHFTGFAPEGSDAASPSAGAIVFSGLAPSISFTSEPAVGAISFAGLAPSPGERVNPGAGAMLITGFAPTPASSSASAPMFSIIV